MNFSFWISACVVFWVTKTLLKNVNRVRIASMKKFEIHMHSTFSDGEFSPTRLVDIARGNGVSVLCLTDHDTFEGIPKEYSYLVPSYIRTFVMA